jgi:sugar lactone lactonase YvrE
MLTIMFGVLLSLTTLSMAMADGNTGRWISTHQDIGGVHAIAAIPGTDKVAALDTDLGTVRLGLHDGDERLDLSRWVRHPKGLSIAPDGRIYVVDTDRHHVMFFTPEGNLLGGFGGAGDEPFRMRRPHAVDVNNSIAVVADTGNDRIQLFEPDGQHIGNLEGPALGLRSPEGVALDDAGRIWVADTHNHRVVCLNSNGTVLREIGSWGTFPGLFMEPSGIDARDGRVVVTDRLNHRVQIFDAHTGAVIETWGMHAFLPREADGKVHYPSDAAILEGGDVVIAEPFEERAQRFGVSGTEIEPPAVAPRGSQSHFGPVATTDGRFFCTWEPELRAIHVFDLDRTTPIRLSTFGQPGSRPGQLGNLTAMEVDAKLNLLWTVDAANNRIHEWALNPPPPDSPRFDPTMATLSQSVPLPIAGSGDLAQSDGDLIFLDRGGRTAWKLGGDGHHTPVDLGMGRDPRAFSLLGRNESGQLQGAVLDGDQKVIRLNGQWPDSTGTQSTISLADLIDPVDFDVAEDGSFFVVDRSGHRVHRFARDGTPLNAWGEQGIDHEQFWRPAAIVVDHHNRVIVLDHGNHRAQMFQPDGTWIMTFSGGRSWRWDHGRRRPTKEAPQLETPQ